MKSNMLLGLALFGLSALPVAAQAVDASVSYNDAMKCATLYSYLSDEEESEAKADAFFDLSFGWSNAASSRDGTMDGSRADLESEASYEQLAASISSMKSKAAKAYLASEAEQCVAKQAIIASEFQDASN